MVEKKIYRFQKHSTCDGFYSGKDFWQFDCQTMSSPWSLSDWDIEISKSSTQAYIMTSKNIGLISMGIFTCSDLMKQAHLLKISTHTEFRGIGVGADLLLNSISDLKRLKMKSVFLEVAVSNDAALHLYRSLGFEVLTTKKKFYSGGIDAYAMQLIF